MSYVECHKCNSEFKVNFFGISKRDQEWRIKNQTWTCDSCFEKEKNKANIEATKEAESMGLPELIGTEKQIKWAETLRIKIVKKIGIILNDLSNGIPKDRLKKAIVIIYGETKASYWIDNRSNNVHSIVCNTLKKIKSPEDEIKSAIEKQMEIEAAIEATIRPSTPITETIAEISINDKKVKIIFKEKREDFRMMVKYELGFLWKDKCWIRDCSSVTSGDVHERAADSGNFLLANGFCIRIYDEVIREKAISGNFEPECKKWVLVRDNGTHKGWFAIWWRTRAFDYYSDSKRITGAKWDNPYMVVSPEQFEEIIDFADIHDFRLSDEALELIKKMKLVKESAFVVDVSRETFYENKSKEMPVLEIPNIVEIDNEFFDDLST